MLSLPQPGDMAVDGGEVEVETFRVARERARANGEDGSSDAKALLIPHTSQEFDCLLECMFWEYVSQSSLNILSGMIKFIHQIHCS